MTCVFSVRPEPRACIHGRRGRRRVCDLSLGIVSEGSHEDQIAGDCSVLAQFAGPDIAVQ